MRPNSLKRVNAGANGSENDKQPIRVNEKFCEALAGLMGQDKLIEFIKFLHELEEKRPRVTQVNFSKSRRESGNGNGNG